MRALATRLASDEKAYTHYLFSKMGYPDYLIALARTALHYAQKQGSLVFDQKRFVCGMQHFESSSFQACINQ